MSKERKEWFGLWLGLTAVAVFVFGAGFAARGAVDRYWAADNTAAAWIISGNDFVLSGEIQEPLTLSCTMRPKSDKEALYE